MTTDDKLLLERLRKEGLTYDDVLLMPRHSSIMPRDVSIETILTPRIALNIPLLSAAMDTVTESEMAIAIAREGGAGVLHKNMSIERQADEVRRVKRSESGMILDPITLHPEGTVADACAMMERYHIGGIPVVDAENRLVGIVTNRDLRFAHDGRTPLSEMMTRENLVTAPVGTTLDQAEALLQRHKIEKLPVVDDDGNLKGLITFKDLDKKRKYPNACKDAHGRLRVGAAIGVTPDVADRTAALAESDVDFLVVDTAHGHSKGVLKTVEQVKALSGDRDVIAGNIGTVEAAEAIIGAGADAVKVGIGPGSICTTRIVAGIGVPQLTAIMDCAAVAHKHGVPVIADGGIKQTGDVPKALAAGADSVMIGGLFARVEESPGETILYEGRKFKSYRGMGSVGAMESGSKDRYFQDAEDDLAKLVPEGIEGRVPYSGNLAEVVHQMLGGLRAAMGYCGAASIRELQETAQFIRVTGAGQRESHPHDVFITKEAPNYSTRL
ncbi:MAG: IMP dehydrogenase [Bacteroidetes bacterium SB0662_bin_6]|nr:IMP dehydrogenase [Bacteroidetes bacterium SB0668_bin_1]MYE04916.1 IMP dehydrogenase [Bacteroidetes bacterium SB0662_bin_6]